MVVLGNLELAASFLLHQYMILTITCPQAYHNFEAYHFIRLNWRARGKLIMSSTVLVHGATNTKIFDFAEHLNRHVSVNKKSQILQKYSNLTTKKRSLN